MRSRELAHIAGVSVRTLRHYHQIGVLPEPARLHNGYRRYTAVDLVRLLRIRHLVELGIALVHIPDILEDDARESTSAVLDRIEADIDVKIAHLNAQRDLVRSARQHGTTADTPLSLGSALVELHQAAGLPQAASRLDLDIATVVAHMSEADAHVLRDSLASIRNGAAPALFEAIKRLAEMPPDTTPDVRQDVADRLRAHLPMVSSEQVPPFDRATLTVVAELQRLRLNDAQLDTIARLQAPDG